jgi:DNA-binding CsgD family transcriptional regulator
MLMKNFRTIEIGSMHGNETRVEFCRLAAEGMAYVEIAQRLHIGLTSLIQVAH